MKAKHWIVSLSLVSCAWNGVHAASGASFLKIPVGARAVGLGGAYTAVSNDVTALHWNPAGLTRVVRKELGLMHAELFAGTRFDFVGYAMPIRNAEMKPSGWTWGAGAVYLTHGSIEGRDESGQKSGSFSASDFAFNLGLGHRLSKRSSLGGNLKLLRETIGSDSANGFAADLGLLTQTPRLSMGLSVQNIGPGMKFDQERYSLPLTLSGGLGYKLQGGLMASMDYRYRPSDNVSSLSLGGELSILSAFAVRAGYLSHLSSLQRTKGGKSSLMDQFSGLGIGFGTKIRGSQIDYAMTPLGELGTSQRLSLTLRF